MFTLDDRVFFRLSGQMFNFYMELILKTPKAQGLWIEARQTTYIFLN